MDDPVLKIECPHIHLTLLQQILQLVLVRIGSIADFVHLDIMFALLEIEESLIGDITCCGDILDDAAVVDDRVETELNILINASLRNDKMLAGVELMMTLQ